MSTELVTVNNYYEKIQSSINSYKDFMGKLSRDPIRSNNENTERVSNAIVQANHATQNALKTIDDDLFFGFSQMSSGLSDVSREIGHMNANMNIAFARLGNVIEASSHRICSKLDELNNIMTNPALTKSREFYKRAITNYNKNYYEEAVEDLQKAIAENKTDYMAWFLLGKAYLFGVSKFVNIIDLDKAIESFTNSAKYIDHDAGNYPEAKQMASEIWFFLGLAQHSKGIDELHNQNNEGFSISIQNAYDSDRKSVV